jgi:hypothetical protein
MIQGSGIGDQERQCRSESGRISPCHVTLVVTRRWASTVTLRQTTPGVAASTLPASSSRPSRTAPALGCTRCDPHSGPRRVERARRYWQPGKGSAGIPRAAPLFGKETARWPGSTALVWRRLASEPARAAGRCAAAAAARSSGESIFSSFHCLPVEWQPFLIRLAAQPSRVRHCETSRERTCRRQR